MKIKAEVRENNNNTLASAFHFQSITDFLYYSNFSVGLCTAGAAWMGELLNFHQTSLSCLIFIFCATVFVYNVDRMSISNADLINNPDRCKWIQNNSQLTGHINILLLAVAGWFLIGGLSVIKLTAASLLLAVCFMYKYQLKKIPLLKNLTVATVWSFTVSILPLLWANHSFNFTTIIFFGFCFLIALANTIIFDLRDLKGDKIDKVKSLPAVAGIKASNAIFYVTLASSFTLSLLFTGSWVLGIIPITLLLISLGKESRIKYLLADLVLSLPLIFIF